MQTLHRVRDRAARERTALVNQFRAILFVKTDRRAAKPEEDARPIATPGAFQEALFPRDKIDQRGHALVASSLGDLRVIFRDLDDSHVVERFAQHRGRVEIFPL